MPSKFEFKKGKMVPYPSGAIVLERTGNTHAVDLVDRLARSVLTVEQDGACLLYTSRCV